MRLNSRAVQSHFVIEGFNDTSKEWYQIWHCPSGIDGPMAWREFKCIISVPEDTSKLRLKINAGWTYSSKPNDIASTWYDEISIIPIHETSIRKATVWELSGS